MHHVEAFKAAIAEAEVLGPQRLRDRASSMGVLSNLIVARTPNFYITLQTSPGLWLY